MSKQRTNLKNISDYGQLVSAPNIDNCYNIESKVIKDQ
jgi:hypothetical protein